MNTQQKIEAAEQRIKELKLLIKSWEKDDRIKGTTSKKT
jgi:hypothetical protein